MYPDANNEPTVTLMDRRIWKAGTRDATEFDDWNAKSLELLEPQVSDDPLGKENSKFVKSLLEEASSMTIVPMFVQLDEGLVPETDLEYDEELNKMDYDHDSFTNLKKANIAARPYSGGKWFYHIVIVHKSKARKLPGSDPVMSVLRIMEDGKLTHLLTKLARGRGQFENPNLEKDVIDMAPVTIGRQSFLITSSLCLERSPLLLEHEDYSVVEAFRLDDSKEPVTAVTGRIGYVKSIKLTSDYDTVQTYYAAGVASIDFYTHVHVAILDRESLETDAKSRIRVFQFNPESPAPSQVLTLAYELIPDDGLLYTAIHSFERKGLKYLSVSRPGKAILFKATANGALEKISELEDDAMTELIPVASGRTKEDVSLVEFGIKDCDITGKRLHPYGFPLSLDQATTVSERDINGPVRVIDIAKKFVIKKNKVLATLPVWGKHYEVSFDLRIDSYPTSSTWAEILRFSSTGNDCCSAGDRIPALFAHEDGSVVIATQLGDNGNFHKKTKIDAQQWTKIEIRQFQEGNEVRLYLQSHVYIL